MFSYSTLKIMTGLLGNKWDNVSDPSVLSLIAGHAVIFDNHRPHNYASHYTAHKVCRYSARTSLVLVVFIY